MKPPPHPAGAQPPAKRKRPKLVWAILIFYVLGALFMLTGFAAIRQGKIPLAPDHAALLAEFGTFDFAWSIIMGALGLYAAICLFQLRAVAARLFLILVAIQFITLVWYGLTTNWLTYLLASPSQLFGYLSGLAFSVGFWYYADRLKRKGVLRPSERSALLLR